jgi:hypothetical protein
MNLLTVIPFRISDAPQAERLCDLMFHQNNRKQLPAVLLVADSSVHGEMREKVNVAATVAFVQVRIIVPPAVTAPTNREAIAQRFEAAAKYVSTHYRWPWVWFEPDAVPLMRNWQKYLARAFDEQPYLACAAHLNIKREDKTEVIPTRVGVYSPSVTALPKSISSVGRINEIQHLYFEADTPLEKIRKDAFVMHPDKGGHLIRKLMDTLPSKE